MGSGSVRRWQGLASGALALLVAPAIATGATVSYSESNEPRFPYDSIGYEAAPGEVNELEVRADEVAAQGRSLPTRTLTFRDGLVPITPAPGDASVHCTAGIGLSVCHNVHLAEPNTEVLTGFFANLTVEVADGSDRVLIRGTNATSALVDGGAGDDAIEFAGTFGAAVAGPGADRVTAVLPAHVTADYARVGEPVTVTLDDVANDGVAGEGDNIGSSVTRITGSETAANTLVGSSLGNLLWGGDGDDVMSGEGGADDLFGHDGDDVLTGGTLGDDLNGGPGDDRLEGGDGFDFLVGWSGDDVLVGGPGQDEVVADAGHPSLIGDDRIEVRDGERDRVDCGGGIDIVIADALDQITVGNCETIEIG